MALKPGWNCRLPYTLFAEGVADKLSVACPRSHLLDRAGRPSTGSGRHIAGDDVAGVRHRFKKPSSFADEIAESHTSGEEASLTSLLVEALPPTC